VVKGRQQAVPAGECPSVDVASSVEVLEDWPADWVDFKRFFRCGHV